MKAVVLTDFGPPEVLQLQEVATPAPKDSEVLIRVYATTVTAGECELRGLRVSLALKLPLRIYARRIRPQPVILGQELAGEIAAVGKDVTRFKIGDQVTAWTALRLGAYAEYTCLPGNGVIATKPSNMTYEEAATLPIGGLDSLHLLRKANIQPGQRVLVCGAGGSIGTYAVQLARYYGAVVTAVDSGGKLDMLRSIGADQVVDYTREDFTRRAETYDVIFDVVGKTSVPRTARLLTPNGYYLFGNSRLIQRMQGRLIELRSNKKVIHWAGRSATEYARDFNTLRELIEAGKIRAIVDRCFPLEETAAAHRYVESGQKKGHVAITVGR